ncbi:hypothetical protein EGR_09675 [Echinococcus granulosus]|uniref:Uncharacterized protein n=1 Tax=Echinococcus granulosus TaxID=6210 RepID=W6UAJ8_ECHGR|nr:hypothetical protein EGR_09675 [Echinococcus granulosus]EUB55467.1 hypothetical protein EGR_09675 [Echinococcus granulosus]
MARTVLSQCIHSSPKEKKTYLKYLRGKIFSFEKNQYVQDFTTTESGDNPRRFPQINSNSSQALPCIHFPLSENILIDKTMAFLRHKNSINKTTNMRDM